MKVCFHKQVIAVVTTAGLAMTTGCAKDDKNDNRSGSGDAKGEHSNGQDPDGAETPNADGQVLLETLLRLAPLEEGHMMADLMSSTRVFRPGKGMGAWQTVGFTWTDVGDLPESTKETTLSVAFATGSEIETECRVDNGKWTVCAGAFTTKKLIDGFHELHVRTATAKTIIGTYRWRVDTKAPKVFAVRSVTGDLVTVEGNEALAAVACELDGATVDCKDGFAAATGSLAVTATDAAGNETKATLTL